MTLQFTYIGENFETEETDDIIPIDYIYDLLNTNKIEIVSGLFSNDEIVVIAQRKPEDREHVFMFSDGRTVIGSIIIAKMQAKDNALWFVGLTREEMIDIEHRFKHAWCVF